MFPIVSGDRDSDTDSITRRRKQPSRTNSPLVIKQEAVDSPQPGTSQESSTAAAGSSIEQAGSSASPAPGPSTTDDAEAGPSHEAQPDGEIDIGYAHP